MKILNEIKKNWKGGLIGGILGFLGFYILTKINTNFTFALVDEGLLDKVITTSTNTLAEYKVLITFIVVGIIVGIIVDSKLKEGWYKKYFRGFK